MKTQVGFQVLKDNDRAVLSESSTTRIYEDIRDAMAQAKVSGVGARIVPAEIVKSQDASAPRRAYRRRSQEETA